MLFELDFGVGAPDVEGKLGRVERERRHTDIFQHIWYTEYNRKFVCVVSVLKAVL